MLSTMPFIHVVAAQLGTLGDSMETVVSTLTGASPEEAASLLGFALKAFVSVFVILDPPGLVPVFLSMTAEDGPAGRRKVAGKASAVCFAILLAFVLGGPYVLSLFGITIPAFRIAGGILLFSIAMGMLRVEMPRTKSVPEEVIESRDREDVSIFPLGIPMLAGPGTIATVIVLSDGPILGPKRLILLGAVLTSVVCNYVILVCASPLERLVGRTGMNIMNRIMGLILAVMAVQFVIDGVQEVLPSLVSVLER